MNNKVNLLNRLIDKASDNQNEPIINQQFVEIEIKNGTDICLI